MYFDVQFYCQLIVALPFIGKPINIDHRLYNVSRFKDGGELYCNQDTWKQEVINNGGAPRIILALSFTAHLPLLQCGFFRKICMSLFSSRLFEISCLIRDLFKWDTALA